ncbi:hypothetical protein BH09MYX1_BH09MYX1_40900 [soil metagenome]
MRASKVFGVAVLAFAGCSRSAVTLGLDVGSETDALKRAPAVVTLSAEAVDPSGNHTALGSATLPQTEFDLTDAPRASYLSLEITGKDATATKVLFGRSVVLQLGAADGTTLPIFVQRTGEWARMPSPLADDRARPLIVATSRTFIVAGGGEGTTASQVLTGYDFATLHALGAYGVSAKARSLAISNAAALLVGDEKTTALGFDLQGATQFAITVPDGATFDEVAGGATIIGDAGESYVVGPSRTTGAPTVRILKVSAAGLASFVNITKPRLGAAALWVKNRGLFVFGGTDGTVDGGAGAELLAKDATVATPIDFAPDKIQGAAAAVLDGSTVLLVGGDDGGAAAATRVVDAACFSKCTATPWGAPLPIKTTVAAVFTLFPTSALLVADDETSATRTFRLDTGATTEIATRLPRHAARAARAPTGNVVLVGGGSAILESFIP